MRNISNRFLDCIIIAIGTFLAVLVWFPMYEQYHRSEDWNIQNADDIDVGFKMVHVSILNLPYAYKNVALAGTKELGYTRFISGTAFESFRIKYPYFILLVLSNLFFDHWQRKNYSRRRCNFDFPNALCYPNFAV